MAILLGIVCLIWLIHLQQKLDKISSSIDSLSGAKRDFHDSAAKHTAEEPIIPDEAETQQEKPEGVLLQPVNEVVPEQELELESESESEPQPQPQPELEPEPNISPVVNSYEKSKDDFELQNAFLGNIFNKIGAIAIIVAVIIFIKLVSPFIVITPLMKIVLGFFAGLGMVGGALYMHKKDELKNYSEVLLGTGFATLFITTFCGYSMFNLYNTGFVLSVGGILLLATFLLADKMQTVSMLVIGLIGGYLTPCFSGAAYEVSMWYLIFLNIVSIVFTLRNQRFRWINIVNLIITMHAFLPYAIDSDATLLPFVLWGVYVIYDFLREKSDSVDYAVCIVNFVVLILFSMLLYTSSHESFYYMLAIAACTYVCFALNSYVSKNQLYKTYVYYALLILWLGILFLSNNVVNVAVWSFVGLGLAVICAKFKQNFLSGAIYWYFLTAFVGALLAKVNNEFVMFANYAPILNVRTLVFGLPVATSLLSALVLRKESKNTSDLLLFSGLSLGYLYLVGEINSILTGYSGKYNYNRWMINVIVGLCYTLQTKKLYKSTNNILFNIASWIFMVVSLLGLVIGSIIYLHTMKYPVININCAIYIMAILMSVLFQRWTQCESYKYLSVILGFILIWCETTLLSVNLNIPYLVSVGWILYSGVITTVGILLNKRYLINSGIFLVILSILRIFIYDLAKVDALYKLIAFLVLGICLMTVSYIYNFHKKDNK